MARTWNDPITLTWQGDRDSFLTPYEEKKWEKIKADTLERYCYSENRHEIELQIMCEDMGLWKINIKVSLYFNFTASNNNIVRNYFKDDIINGEQDPSLDVWDAFFDFGDPNRQYQQLGINYEIPINKIPTLSFINATYSYTGEFQWQKVPIKSV